MFACLYCHDWKEKRNIGVVIHNANVEDDDDDDDDDDADDDVDDDYNNDDDDGRSKGGRGKGRPDKGREGRRESMKALKVHLRIPLLFIHSC